MSHTDHPGQVLVPKVLAAPFNRCFVLLEKALRQQYLNKTQRMVLRERLEPLAQLASQLTQGTQLTQLTQLTQGTQGTQLSETERANHTDEKEEPTEEKEGAVQMGELAAALWRCERELQEGIRNTRLRLDHSFLRQLRTLVIDLVLCVHQVDPAQAKQQWRAALAHVRASKRPAHPRLPVEPKPVPPKVEALAQKYAVYLSREPPELGVLEQHVAVCTQQLELQGLESWKVVPVGPFVPCSVKAISTPLFTPVHTCAYVSRPTIKRLGRDP